MSARRSIASALASLIDVRHASVRTDRQLIRCSGGLLGITEGMPGLVGTSECTVAKKQQRRDTLTMNRASIKGIINLALCLTLTLFATHALAECPHAPLTDIHAIKGYGTDALTEGQTVVVEGVVTGEFLGRDRLNGFYIQHNDKQAGSPAGIFVYLPNVPPRERKLIQPGNQLQVHAQTGNFRGQPQLQRVSRIELCAREQLPPALTPHWPLTPAQAKRLEGLLLTFPHTLTVTGNYELGRYGTLHLAKQRLYRPTSDGPQAKDRSVLILDDGSYRAFPSPIPYLDEDGTRRVGSTLAGLTGVLAYAFNDYRLHPTKPPRFQSDNPRPEPPPPPGERIRIAAFNVENYFTRLGARGAATEDELNRQRAKLRAVAEGLDADILALMEIENDSESLDDFIAHLNDGLPQSRQYQAVAGSADRGDDAIKVAFIYRPARVKPLSDSYSDTDSAHLRPRSRCCLQRLKNGHSLWRRYRPLQVENALPAGGRYRPRSRLLESTPD
ncbi:endonuclease [Alkalilimnicola ehrlichii]|uniref:endonuclease n=1 Tax=Alkalilimnicola ehrlichii TaxID=351052 RepID=UPI0011C040D7|nr:endonuclease [Alkalilimnicola ehrlichii]